MHSSGQPKPSDSQVVDQLTIGTVTRGKFEYAHRIVNLLDGEIVTDKVRMAV